MDKIDLNILSALQNDGRLTNVELADKIGLSPSPCLRRVKRLEQDGVITSYRATIARSQIGLTMTVFVDVTLDNHRDQASNEFEKAVIDMTNVVSCHLVSGSADYRLEVVVSHLMAYETFLKKLQSLPYVKDIHSNFAIRAVKTNAPLPLSESASNHRE